MKVRLVALVLHRLRSQARRIGLEELRAAVAAEAGFSEMEVSDAELREALLAVERSNPPSAVMTPARKAATCGGLPPGWIPTDTS
jgi:hypothetical protein